MCGRKFPQPREVCGGGWLQHPQHERGRVVGDRHLDLRQLLADLELIQESGERADQRAGRRREHLAVRQLRDVGRGALAKADDHAVLLAHELGTEPRAPAVTPGRSAHRLEPALRLDRADAREGVLELALLGGKLGGGVQVL
jgi:hypothetical protein